MSSAPLLPSTGASQPKARRITHVLSSLFIPLLLVTAVIYVAVVGERAPKNDLERANYYLKTSPVIDGHIDLPELLRVEYGNDVNKINLREKSIGHVDIPRIKKGHLGGFFWSVYVDCKPEEEGIDFLIPSGRVRDTLEQIDVAKNLMAQYPDTFELALTAADVRGAISRGKVASLLGVEGAHQLGNSLGVLRQYAELGVRYITLTHMCNNAFADSAGIFHPIKPAHGGLSDFGRELVKEMNRLGVLVDLSHVADTTALQALEITKAPVILSHSASRHFNNISRNVPHQVLAKIGRGRGKVDGVVMVNFFPRFVSDKPESVNVSSVADHIEWIAKETSKKNVGIGSDYDGIESVPKGLEDVSTYPHLFAELIRRGWERDDLADLAGGNILRILEGAERVSNKLKKERAPSMAVYKKRHDLDGGGWSSL